MANLYSSIEQYDCGMLDVGRWTSGLLGDVRQSVRKALVLHGGPGSGCSTGMRRYFDPEVYRVVLFDQRGAGRSTAHASDPKVDLSANMALGVLRPLTRRLSQAPYNRPGLAGTAAS
jgi:proline iminopeptidase